MHIKKTQKMDAQLAKERKKLERRQKRQQAKGSK
jgi:AmiR/NasT family two-component response regulator